METHHVQTNIIFHFIVYSRGKVNDTRKNGSKSKGKENKTFPRSSKLTCTSLHFTTKRKRKKMNRVKKISCLMSIPILRFIFNSLLSAFFRHTSLFSSNCVQGGISEECIESKRKGSVKKGKKANNMKSVHLETKRRQLLQRRN